MFRDPSCLDKLATILVGADVASSAAAGLPAPPGVLEGAAARGGLLAMLHGRRAIDRDAVVGRLRTELERQWEAWGETASMADPHARASAVASFEAVIGRCAPAPAGLVGARLNGAAVAAAVLEAAELALPVAYADRDLRNAEAHLARSFLLKLTTRAYDALLAEPDFVARLAPDLWRGALEGLEDIRAEQLRQGEEQRRQSQALDDLKAQIAELAGGGATGRAAAEREVAALRSAHADNGAAVVNLLRLLLAREVAVENWGEAIAEAERRALALLDGDALRLPNEASEAERDLIARARAAIEARDFTAAETALRAARELGRERRRDAVELLAAQDAAETARIAEAVAAGLDRLRAADLYAEAAATPGLSARERWRHELARAGALQAHGRDAGDNASVTEAVRIYRDVALPLAPRGERSDDWATTQNNLGAALRTLGAREGGTARLEEAVAAYRAALEEYKRERVPLDWAMTQNNLGNALQTLGEREGGTARLEQAVAAYRAALEERRRERVPLDWAMTQNNLGAALQTLGEREGGTARLEQAVAAYRAALEERKRERVPLDWAATQNNLGVALATLGERESGTARLEEAVAAYRAALEERRRERVPLGWAETQNNLGNALRSLGEREAGPARLEEAVAAYRAALEERRRERAPFLWALSQENLGLALMDSADRRGDVAAAEQAVAALNGALGVYLGGGAGFYMEECGRALAMALVLRYRLAGG